MSGDDPFGRVLEALHAAAFDDAAWPAASGLIDALCGSTGNILVAGDGAPADGVDVFFAPFCHRGQLRPDWQREYFEVFYLRCRSRGAGREGAWIDKARSAIDLRSVLTSFGDLPKRADGYIPTLLVFPTGRKRRPRLSLSLP